MLQVHLGFPVRVNQKDRFLEVILLGQSCAHLKIDRHHQMTLQQLGTGNPSYLGG
jgi:hypothetical protein